MAHNPYHVGKRKPLTPKQRLQMFLEHKGICCLCGTKIDPKEAWIDEHERALWLAREGEDLNAAQNRGPAHLKCAKQKTAKEATERAKGRKAAERHFGAKRAKTKPMPFGRRSLFKRKMDGSVVRRDEG